MNIEHRTLNIQRRNNARRQFHAPRSTLHAPRSIRLRLLTAVPICDGHDSAINTINVELIRHGIEVIYLGYHRSARDIVRAAIQEDVRAIGISSYNGGHVDFFAEVIDLLKKNGAADIGVFGGGGGTITRADAATMQRKGVDRIFFAGTPLSEIMEFVKKQYGKPYKSQSGRSNGDVRMSKLLSALTATLDARRSMLHVRTIGITGPGGAGKTTLIDELVLRHLKANPKSRIAILSHDPSLVEKGALLGDRAAMIHSQDDRVFMRSLATRGKAGGLSAGTGRCLQLLKDAGFELILVETIGIGQEAMPFAAGSVDKTILVMSPEYGSRLQLQKIAMLDVADLVVLNKSDLAGAKTARAEIENLLSQNQRGQKLLATVAKRHRDTGMDQLFEFLRS